MEWHFETSWEVCHKQGGIYTALVNRAPAMMQKMWGHRYFMIGPYLHEKTDSYFIEQPKPPWIMDMENDRGHPLGHFGCWNIPGAPLVFLLDFHAWMNDIASLSPIIDSFCTHETRRYFYPLSHEIIKECAFGAAVDTFFSAFKKTVKPTNVSVAFHEWQSACAVPLLKKKQLVHWILFTTHATQLGRLRLKINTSMPQGYNIEQAPIQIQKNQALKHIIENQITQEADQFIVTSSHLAKEAKKYLGRDADKILLPGLDIKNITKNLNQLKNREILDQFFIDQFPKELPEHSENHFKFIIAARHEYHNKGFDVTLKAMKYFNEKLAREKSPWRVTLIVVTDHPSIEPQENPYKTLENTPDWFLTDHPVNPSDPIVRAILVDGLYEKKNAVKILYHPAFIEKKGCFGLDYLELVSACDLGLFPSAYEPWGYAPLEALMLGVPVVISKQCGLTEYLQQKHPALAQIGAFLIDRKEGTLEEQAQRVADILYDYCTHPERYKNNAVHFSQHEIKELDYEHLSFS